MRVVQVQYNHGLTKDGTYGPKTRAKMCWHDPELPEVDFCGIAG